ncbi:hypothetical protein HDF24_00300 [Mucilaginibacter sp. X4EP1]|uniref:hypothetical protein n=1 Tax=Mucilaginibacter sp. X4EP1 TaxID=2723092 RepID=UPI002168E307|nr:hypothetical protein [Mucilaginibacter sp. X4EP1]MCS3811449.1 hypothetical protein [Mucilaginibacter sp. X4EP1]
MKTALYFIITCFISTGALLGATNAKNPFPLFGIAFGIWVLFIWGYTRRSKIEAEKRSRERRFEEHMRDRLRKN